MMLKLQLISLFFLFVDNTSGTTLNIRDHKFYDSLASQGESEFSDHSKFQDNSKSPNNPEF